MSLVNLLPESIRKVQSSAAPDDLSKYELNPLLLTAYLLDQVKTRSSYTHSLEDFTRTYRIPDTLASSVKLYQPEIYKGYLSFKSTKYDLIYYLKQLGVDAEISEKVPSGPCKKEAGLLLIANSLSPRSWKIQGTGTTDLKIINAEFIEDNLPNLCEIVLDVVLYYDESSSSNAASILYNKISTLILNRLAAYTYLGEINININLVSSLDKTALTDDIGMDLEVNLMSDNLLVDTRIVQPTSDSTPFKIQSTGSLTITGFRLTDSNEVSNAINAPN